MKPEQCTIENLGSCDSITVTKEDTVILNGSGPKEAIQERIEQIKGSIDITTTNSYEKEKLQERLAKLSGVLLSSGSVVHLKLKLVKRRTVTMML